VKSCNVSGDIVMNIQSHYRYCIKRYSMQIMRDRDRRRSCLVKSNTSQSIEY
jgi:hypothetical protein